MPIYQYSPAQKPCRLCGEGFEHSQPADAAPLTDCPTCGRPVARAGVCAINTPKLLKPLSVSDAKSLGFKVFKKTSAGELERQ